MSETSDDVDFIPSQFQEGFLDTGVVDQETTRIIEVSEHSDERSESEEDECKDFHQETILSDRYVGENQIDFSGPVIYHNDPKSRDRIQNSMIGGTVILGDPKLERRNRNAMMNDEERWKINFGNAWNEVNEQSFAQYTQLEEIKKDIRQNIPRWMHTNPALMVAGIHCAHFVREGGNYDSKIDSFIRTNFHGVKSPSLRFDIKRYAFLALRMLK